MIINIKQRLFEMMERLNPSFKLKEEVNKPKFIIPIGISGSGKSTWIVSQVDSNTIIISPDNIRRELTGTVNDQSRGREVFQIAYHRTVDALNSGKSVIFDATNISSSERRNMLKYLRKKVDVDFDAFAKIFDIDPKISKERIKKDIESGIDRSNVPPEIIDKQYQKYIGGLDNVETDGYKIIN